LVYPSKVDKITVIVAFHAGGPFRKKVNVKLSITLMPDAPLIRVILNLKERIVKHKTNLKTMLIEGIFVLQMGL